MPINIAFAGARIGRPGAYSTVDTSGMVPVTLGAFNVLAFVGTMDATATVEPKKAVYFNDPAIAKQAVKTGLFKEAVDTAWGHGADLICFVRVDNALQAKGSITGEDSAEVFEVIAKDFGTNGNEITYDISVDAEGNTKTINIAKGGLIEQFKISAGTTNEEVAKLVSKKSKYVTLIKKSDEAFAEPVIPTNLIGGAGGGTVTDADWQEAIDVLRTEDVQGIVPVTVAPAIQAKVNAHVENMSTVKNRKERRGFYGHDVDMTVDEIVELKEGLNTERAMLATPCPYIYGESGEKELRNSVIIASAYAGMWSSKEPQDPITYDYVQFAGLEKRYDSAEIEKLLSNGIAVTEFVKGKGYRIVQGITTYTGEDISKSELSVSTLKDAMSINMREFMEDKHVGKAGVSGVEITIYNDAVSVIGTYQKAGWITGYVPGSIKIVKEGTAFRVDWEGIPTLPINNFLITSHFTL